MISKEQKVKISEFKKYYEGLEKDTPYYYHLDEKNDLKSWKEYALEATSEAFKEETEAEEAELLAITKSEIEDKDRNEMYKYMVIKFDISMEDEKQYFEDEKTMYNENEDTAKVLLLLREISNYIPAMESVTLDYAVNKYMYENAESNPELYHSVNKNDTTFESRIQEFLKENSLEDLIEYINEVLLEKIILEKGLLYDIEKLKKIEDFDKEAKQENRVAKSILKVDINGLKNIKENGVLSIFQKTEDNKGQGIKK